MIPVESDLWTEEERQEHIIAAGLSDAIDRWMSSGKAPKTFKGSFVIGMRGLIRAKKKLSSDQMLGLYRVVKNYRIPNEVEPKLEALEVEPNMTLVPPLPTWPSAT